MSREKDIELLIKGVLEAELAFWDNPNGAYEYTCPFCSNKKCVGGNEGTPSISDVNHDQSCVYLIAKDLSTKR